MDDLNFNCTDSREILSYLSKNSTHASVASIDDFEIEVKDKITNTDKLFLLMKELSKQNRIRKLC